MRVSGPSRGLILGLLAGALAACDGTPSEQTPDDASVRPSTDAGATDLGAVVEPTARLGDIVRLETEDEVLEGELVHIYDQRRWWATMDADTWHLFVADAFAPYPDDRSSRFIDARAVKRVLDRTPATTHFLETQGARGLVLERSPFDAPAFVITAHERYHLEEDGRGDFAWDLVMTSTITRERWRGEGSENADYFVYDQPVYLPTAGTVVELVRDAPDNPPGFYPEGAINNLVGVHLGGQYYLYLLHFRPGSIPTSVELGVTLETGTYLGRVGNAGVSLEPHLHLTVLYFDEITGRTWSVPSAWLNLYRGPTDHGGQLETQAVPRSGEWISSAPF